MRFRWSGVAFGDFCLKDAVRLTGGAGTRLSNVLRRLCTSGLAPGAGKTFGNPGVLLSPEELRTVDGVGDSAPEPLPLPVSFLLKENLRVWKLIPGRAPN